MLQVAGRDGVYLPELKELSCPAKAGIQYSEAVISSRSATAYWIIRFRG